MLLVSTVGMGCYWQLEVETWVLLSLLECPGQITTALRPKCQWRRLEPCGRGSADTSSPGVQRPLEKPFLEDPLRAAEIC